MRNARAMMEAIQRLEEKLDKGHVTRFCYTRGRPLPRISETDVVGALEDAGYGGLIVRNTCVLCGQWIPPSLTSRARHMADETLNVMRLVVMRQRRRSKNV